jgi:hypothetical protein
MVIIIGYKILSSIDKQYELFTRNAQTKILSESEEMSLLRDLDIRLQILNERIDRLEKAK